MEKDLLEQFENLHSIEPSEEWNDKLLQRLNSPHHAKGNTTALKMALIAVVVLLAFNIFSITKMTPRENRQQESTNLRSIANEFLIYSNSSKY